MKKLLTILCAAILTLSVSAQAQFGAVGGLNISSIATSAIGGPDASKIGIRLGGVANISLGDAMQLRTGLIYSQKGAIMDMTDDGVIATGTVKLDYLEIPIEVDFKLGDALALSAGPYIAFNMKKNMAIEAAGVDAGEVAFAEVLYTEFLDVSVSGVDFGLNFGMSYTIEQSFLIGAHYGIGLMNIYQPIPDGEDDDFLDIFDASTDDVWKNGCFSISIAYMLGS